MQIAHRGTTGHSKVSSADFRAQASAKVYLNCSQSTPLQAAMHCMPDLIEGDLLWHHAAQGIDDG